MKKLSISLIIVLSALMLLTAPAFAVSDYDVYAYDSYDYYSYDYETDEDYVYEGEEDGILPYVWISLAAGFFISLISVIIMASGMKTVNSARNASSYIVAGSFNLRSAHDYYLYRTVTKTPKADNQSKSRK